MKVIPIAQASPAQAGKRVRVSDRSPKRKPMAPDLARRVGPMLDYLESKIRRLPDRDAQAGAVRWLLEAGYAPDECKDCLDHQLRTWTKGRVSWLSVKMHIGSWLATSGNAPRKGNDYAKESASEQRVRGYGEFADLINVESEQQGRCGPEPACFNVEATLCGDATA